MNIREQIRTFKQKKFVDDVDIMNFWNVNIDVPSMTGTELTNAINNICH